MAKQQSVTPLHDRVIVKPIAVDSKTQSGIIIPDAAKQKPQKGTVMAAGKGLEAPLTVKTGDNVLYGKNAGLPIEFDNEQCLIMKESDILAII